MRAEVGYHSSRRPLCSGTGMTSHSAAVALPPSTQSSNSDAGVSIDTRGTQMRPLDAPRLANRNESAEDYSRVVAVLNSKWRVIECRDGAQWILQSRDTRPALENSVWRGRSYCRTKQALLRVCTMHAAKINATASAVLAALPDWFEAPNLPGTQSMTKRGEAKEQS